MAHASLATAAALLMLLRLAPHSVWWPPCPIYALLGLRCPGCGATRALGALLHADLDLAWRENALFVVALPGLLLYAAGVYRQLTRAGEFRWPSLPTPALMGALACAFAFALARNAFGF